MTPRLLFILPLWLSIGTATGQPRPFYYADLPYAPTVCSDTSFSTDAVQTGIGEQVDLDPTNRGCLVSGELQGFWLAFHLQSAGAVGFSILPIAGADYDFGVWGPFQAVPLALDGPPLRCSYATALATNATGLDHDAVDVSEAATGDGRVRAITGLDDEWYVLYITNFSMNGVAFDLTWDLRNGAALQCQDPPEAAFQQSGSLIPAGSSVSFTDQSTENPFAWWWQFEGGIPVQSFEFAPDGITYALPGCYDVTLTAYNAAGDNTLVTTCQVMVEASTDIAAQAPQDFTITQVDGTLRIVPTTSGSYSLRMMDGTGRLVCNKSAFGPLELSSTDLTRGVYTVVLDQASERRVQRIVLVR